MMSTTPYGSLRMKAESSWVACKTASMSGVLRCRTGPKPAPPSPRQHPSQLCPGGGSFPPIVSLLFPLTRFLSTCLSFIQWDRLFRVSWSSFLQRRISENSASKGGWGHRAPCVSALHVLQHSSSSYPLPCTFFYAGFGDPSPSRPVGDVCFVLAPKLHGTACHGEGVSPTMSAVWGVGELQNPVAISPGLSCWQ